MKTIQFGKMANNKQKLKLLELPGINQLIYDAITMYIGEVLGSSIDDSTPAVCKGIIEKLKRQYADKSPVQKSLVQVDLEDAISALKQIYPKQFEKYEREKNSNM